jgi:vacuolar-type H+-ATPase subunit F/Vma7
VTLAGIAAIGEGADVRGYALAGVVVHAAADPAAALRAWEALPADVGCLLLTEAAHAVLAGRLHERPELLWAVVPA